jgi:2-oxoglutarate ferredoxin oxidoreductase subunit beta
MSKETAVSKKRVDKLNKVGLAKTDYKGGPSTLCQGCGHNSISSQIISAFYELSIKPERIMKLSGIGCSSKSPTYFMNRSHGFNSLHGRMPSLATGASMANRDLKAIGVTGDGDTASIGIGQFIHLLRRNVPMVYIIENNGVYGLTKGQFSATADKGQKLKKLGVNPFMPIDLCMEALVANCGFVARAFAGDPKQVKELIKAAINFEGTAVLDIISPCVTFNNRGESTKSYAWGKAHEYPLHDVTWVPAYDEIKVEYEPGEVIEVELHNQSSLVLKKLEREHDTSDRLAAMQVLEETCCAEVLLTGLIYLNEEQETFHQVENLVETPLALLPQELMRPSAESLEDVMATFR